MNLCIDCHERPPASPKSVRCLSCRGRHAATTRGRQYAPDAASCHPERKAFGTSPLCRWCYEDTIASPRLGHDPRPYVVIGARQHASATLPDVCPHCHAPPPAWRLLGALASCWECGADHFIWSGDVITAADAAGLLAEQDGKGAAAWAATGEVE